MELLPRLGLFAAAFASLLWNSSAHAVDVGFNFNNFGCAPRSQRELFTPPKADTTTYPRPSPSVTADISFYGDSRITSKCNYVKSDGTKEYSNHGVTLAAKSVPAGMTFAQRGRDGTSLRQLEAGNDAVALTPGTGADANDTAATGRPWADQMNPALGDDSNIVVIAHGTNDAWQDLLNNTGNNAATFEARLDRMVKAAKNAGKRVLLVQPYRVCSYAMVDIMVNGQWRLSETVVVGGTSRQTLRHPDAILAPYAAAVSRVGLANNVHVAPLFSVPVRCNGDYASSDMPDGLHSTTQFNDKLAQVIKDGLDRVIRNRPLSDVKPSLTLLRAPFQELSMVEMARPSKLDYPNIMPAAGQDYQMLQPGLDKNGLPVIQMANWVGANAQSASVSCIVTSTVNGSVEHRAWNGLNGSNVSAPGVMPNPSIWDCIWTATGPGGSVSVPETFRVGSIGTVDASRPAKVTVARSPMPLVAGKSFQTTWRAENAEGLYRWCTASGAGMSDSGWVPMLLSSDPNASVGPKASNFALLNAQTTAQAQSAWVGNPSTCQWAVIGFRGEINYFVEYVHTIAP
ncbi:MAG: SGNH/GDSL hydrolase family protein [Lysobacteraceae bacterium]